MYKPHRLKKKAATSHAGIEFRVTRTSLPDDENHQPAPGCVWNPVRQMWLLKVRSLEELLSLSRQECAELLVCSDEVAPHVVFNDIEICDCGRTAVPEL